MGKRISQQQHSYQIQIDLSWERLDGEICHASAVCDDLRHIRGAVGLLLDLCKDGRKIDPVHLSGVLGMLDETLDGTADLANGQRRFLEQLLPTPGLQDGADGSENAGLHLVAVDSIGEN
jgi:hypothetical protein